MYAGNLTREEIQEKINKGYFAVLPIGSCEQHGPHLPVTTDTDLAMFMSREIAKQNNAIIFPPLHFGYSWVWTGLAGTMTLSQDTFKKVVYELGESLAKMGFNKVLLVNGHDSNKMALKYVIRDLSESHTTKFLHIFYPNMNEIYQRHMESKTWNGMFHADEFETSLMMAYNANVVKHDKLICEYPEKPKYYGVDESPLWNVSKSGVFGDATKATGDKGTKMISDFMIEINKIILE